MPDQKTRPLEAEQASPRPNNMDEITNANKLSTRQALKMAMTDRQVLAMLILGLASGLPYVVVAGTLNAWLTTTGVKPVEIGLLSWAILAYSFKYMWAATLQGRKTPLGLKVGPRRFWMFLFLGTSTIGMAFLSMSEPPSGLGLIALIAVGIAFSSSCFDIVLAGWRIEAARDDKHLDILSTVEQFGYRTASIMGGFVALAMADKFGWRPTFFAATALLAISSIGVIIARPTSLSEYAFPATKSDMQLTHRQKNIGTLLVLAGWGLGFYLIIDFAAGALTDPQNHRPRDFIRNQGPWVIIMTVIWLGVVSAVLVWAQGRQKSTEIQTGGGVLSVLFAAIIEPMMELVGRLKWASILILAVILSYRFTDLIWGGFAYPFYLGVNYGALGHTLTEVAFASKLIGVFATIAGIAIGGLAMLRFGRMPVFFFGAVFAAATNLLFADLAIGAIYTDPILTALQIDRLFEAFGMDIRMARLTSVIALENIAVGLASAASIAYLSSIVSKQYAVVQYALLASLVMLLGTLGRPAIGAIIEEDGFATAFVICAGFGAIASVLALIEWIRIARKQSR
jgi:PAT family beta-lactamase induction signal transducer AmpG